MSEGPFTYVSLSEEETWRNADMGEAWDKAEAGEPLYVLLRERIRKAEGAVLEKLRPEIEAYFNEGNAAGGGLSLLVGDD